MQYKGFDLRQSIDIACSMPFWLLVLDNLVVATRPIAHNHFR